MATVETPSQLFVHKLGAALTMEETILEMLEELQDKASDPKLQKQLEQHHTETQQQIQNLRRIFDALGEAPEKQPSPAIEGLEKEGRQMIKEVDEALIDSAVLGSVIETEHHEIAVYEGLITNAQAMGEQEVVRLLQQNLESEEATLEKAKMMGEQFAQQAAAQPV
jgi:ferritin-like metal-binding protein YciE